MALESDDAIRRLLAARPRPQLTPDFSAAVMRGVRQQQREQDRQHRPGARLALGAYWIAALSASVWILRPGPLPEWAAAVLWCAALALVPAGYAYALWSRPEASGGDELPHAPR